MQAWVLCSVRMRNVIIRPVEAADMEWIAERHGALYREENDFDDSFEPFVREVLNSLVKRQDGISEMGWIAEENSERLGCIFCEKDTKDKARLRLFLLVPSARGVGLGKRLLRTCMSFAEASGYAEIWLMTHESHEAACALYRSADWQLERARPVHSFGRDLVEQTWRFRF